MDTNFKASRLDLTWSFFISSLRTSETNYLNEAFSFYAAIRGRAYYSRANREDRYDFCRSVNPGSSKGQPHIFPPLSFFDLSLRRRSTFRRFWRFWRHPAAPSETRNFGAVDFFRVWLFEFLSQPSGNPGNDATRWISFFKRDNYDFLTLSPSSDAWLWVCK